ncbi:hypothetical protein [Inmirania thermothiophila]|uniref:Uncharacterized protein n=1 Tax=Inmirania thermothiophila TaxID=1750597 RepID=A0A3N1Y1I6_9GAMM|nr:hypothetical protein [Inmirania thermothiophila]ROR32685.1 hypothetical protein EDC57_1891 [Inmirania thermothiophila]
MSSKADDFAIDVTAGTEPIGEVLPAAREALCYEGETTHEYVIVPADDPQQRLARVIPAATWEDLRDRAASQLPKPVSALYNVWEVTRAVGKPLYLGSRHLGMTYLVEGGKAVLTNSVSLAFFDLSDVINVIFGERPAPPPCPTTTRIAGSGSAHSAYYTTRAAAAAAARGLVPVRARTDAGLERNAFQCPNPACTTKTLGPVAFAITAVDTALSLVASFFYLEWMYTARADYTWTSSVICRERA